MGLETISSHQQYLSQIHTEFSDEDFSNAKAFMSNVIDEVKKFTSDNTDLTEMFDIDINELHTLHLETLEGTYDQKKLLLICSNIQKSLNLASSDDSEKDEVIDDIEEDLSETLEDADEVIKELTLEQMDTIIYDVINSESESVFMHLCGSPDKTCSTILKKPCKLNNPSSILSEFLKNISSDGEFFEKNGVLSYFNYGIDLPISFAYGGSTFTMSIQKFKTSDSIDIKTWYEKEIADYLKVLDLAAYAISRDRLGDNKMNERYNTPEDRDSPFKIVRNKLIFDAVGNPYNIFTTKDVKFNIKDYKLLHLGGNDKRFLKLINQQYKHRYHGADSSLLQLVD